MRVAGAEKASMLVIAVDNKDKATEIMKVARQAFPHLKLIARAWDMKHMFTFRDAGLNDGDIHRETFESAMDAAGSVLYALGFEKKKVKAIQKEYRQHDQEVIAQMYRAHHDGDDAYINTSLRLSEELSSKLLKVQGSVERD